MAIPRPDTPKSTGQEDVALPQQRQGEPEEDGRGSPQEEWPVGKTSDRSTRPSLRVHARRALSRLDFLSINSRVNPKHEAAMLLLIPLATFGFVCFATSLENVAFQPRCNSVSNFVASLLFQPPRPSTCQSVPFLSDIPTVILSFTSPFALVGYRLLRRRVAWMFEGVAATGLLKDQSSNPDLRNRVSHIERSVDMTAWSRFALFAVCCAMTTWLYWRNLVDGNLFKTLQTIYPDGTTNAAALRASWWANFHSHPVLAFICVFIGSVGVYYALRAGWLYARLGLFLFATRKVDPRTLPLNYVPQWRDKSYGWGPVTGALTLIYFSTVNFAMSMASVYDMLRSETWTLYVATFFALLGVIANLVIILLSLARIVAAHQAVEERLRARLTAIAESGSSDAADGWFVAAASDLASWRRVPTSSASSGIIKVLPGLYALFQFVSSLTRIKW